MNKDQIVERFQIDLQHAFSCVRDVMERYGFKDWEEHLIIRRQGKPESFQTLGNPKGDYFSMRMVELHKTVCSRETPTPTNNPLSTTKTQNGDLKS